MKQTAVKSLSLRLRLVSIAVLVAIMAFAVANASAMLAVGSNLNDAHDRHLEGLARTLGAFVILDDTGADVRFQPSAMLALEFGSTNTPRREFAVLDGVSGAVIAQAVSPGAEDIVAAIRDIEPEATAPTWFQLPSDKRDRHRWRACAVPMVATPVRDSRRSHPSATGSVPTHPIVVVVGEQVRTGLPTRASQNILWAMLALVIVTALICFISFQPITLPMRRLLKVLKLTPPTDDPAYIEKPGGFTELDRIVDAFNAASAHWRERLAALRTTARDVRAGLTALEEHARTALRDVHGDEVAYAALQEIVDQLQSLESRLADLTPPVRSATSTR